MSFANLLTYKDWAWSELEEDEDFLELLELSDLSDF